VRDLNARQDNLMRNDSITLLQDLPLNAQLNLNLRRSTYATCRPRFLLQGSPSGLKRERPEVAPGREQGGL
jgi:hypothetical protein